MLGEYSSTATLLDRCNAQLPPNDMAERKHLDRSSAASVASPTKSITKLILFHHLALNLAHCGIRTGPKKASHGGA